MEEETQLVLAAISEIDSASEEDIRADTDSESETEVVEEPEAEAVEEPEAEAVEEPEAEAEAVEEPEAEAEAEAEAVEEPEPEEEAVAEEEVEVEAEVVEEEVVDDEIVEEIDPNAPRDAVFLGTSFTVVGPSDEDCLIYLSLDALESDLPCGKVEGGVVTLAHPFQTKTHKELLRIPFDFRLGDKKGHIFHKGPVDENGEPTLGALYATYADKLKLASALTPPGSAR